MRFGEEMLHLYRRGFHIQPMLMKEVRREPGSPHRPPVYLFTSMSTMSCHDSAVNGPNLTVESSVLRPRVRWSVR